MLKMLIKYIINTNYVVTYYLTKPNKFASEVLSTDDLFIYI